MAAAVAASTTLPPSMVPSPEVIFRPFSVVSLTRVRAMRRPVLAADLGS